MEDLTLVEPDPHMAARLRERLAERSDAADGAVRAGEPRAAGPDPAARRAPSRLVRAPAERLPFDDDSFDTAVATLVLCTVPDPGAAVAELARVLRPGGRLLFVEHVRSGNPARARWQDRLEKPWRFMADGCHCNRDTAALLDESAFDLDRLKEGSMPKAMPIVRPLIHGSALLA